MVPARAGGEVQPPGPGHPGLLRVAALAQRRAVGMIQQAGQRRIGLILVGETVAAQAAHTPAHIERGLLIPHPGGVGVPGPLAVIARAQRQFGGVVIVVLLAHPRGVGDNQQFLTGRVAPAEIAKGVVVAGGDQRVDPQVGRRVAVEGGIAFQHV